MLRGSYPISHVSVYVSGDAIGIYALSRDGGRSKHYIGRSDTDLRSRIVSSGSQGSYTHFWFDYESSPMQAYKDECELYHEVNPPDNAVHPAVPPGTNWRCPILGCPWS
jgi:hypothetical protein